MKRPNGKILAPFALIMTILIPSHVWAIGQVTEPINITNALREKVYNETMNVVNTESSTSTIKLSAEGDIAGWVRFYKNAADKDNITDIEVPAGSRIEVIARITVPAGTANGKYQGYISVSKKAADFSAGAEDSGNAVAQKIDREVSVEVKDNEEFDFDTSLIPEKYDLMQGELLKIRIIHDNRGNTEIKPQIDFKIKQGEDIIYSAIFPYPENQPGVGANSLFEIPAIEIPLSNFATGKYEAVFKISQADKLSIDKDFTFSVGMVKAANTTTNGTDSNRVWQAAKLFLSIIAIAYIAFLVRSKIIKKQKATR